MNEIEKQINDEVQKRLNDPAFLQEKLILALEKNKRLLEDKRILAETIQSKMDEGKGCVNENARGLIEIAKTIGEVQIVDGIKLFTREFFSVGRFVDLDDTHRVEVAKEGLYQHPFIFVAENDVPGGDPLINQCENEDMALKAIELIMAFAE